MGEREGGRARAWKLTVRAASLQAHDLRSCHLLAQRMVPPAPSQLSLAPLSPFPHSQSLTKFGSCYVLKLCFISVAAILASQPGCLHP